ncbi:hypothetical protein PMAYCL1PPCAC_09321, partial [Pristionchus mayeri]
KELRSTYNFVLFLMTFDQTVVIGTNTFSQFRYAFFAECKPWFFSLSWVLYDIIVSQHTTTICKAHATWTAVILALMRLKSIQSYGKSELPLTHVLMLCAS